MSINPSKQQLKNSVIYIDRQTGLVEKERIYFDSAIRFLYGRSRLGKIFSFFISRFSLASAAVGWWNRLSFSKKKIVPFVEKYQLDATEFLEPIGSYASFDEFFTRKLRPESRPIHPERNSVIAPADGRYLVYPNIAVADGFFVKGEKFQLTQLLQDRELATKYEQGAMVIARLCPTDYHRFHFPIDCTPGAPRLINGYLYSVNPIAVKKNIRIFSQNKRIVTTLDSDVFGKVLFVEVGATAVGSIRQTYTPGEPCHKGDEKGYFSFGGSTLILLFENGRLQLDSDLLHASEKRIEVRCLMGQSLGTRTEMLPRHMLK